MTNDQPSYHLSQNGGHSLNIYPWGFETHEPCPTFPDRDAEGGSPGQKAGGASPEVPDGGSLVREHVP